MNIEISVILKRLGNLRKPRRIVARKTKALTNFGDDMKRKIRKYGESHLSLKNSGDNCAVQKFRSVGSRRNLEILISP